jgi:hypothetical protein
MLFKVKWKRVMMNIFENTHLLNETASVSIGGIDKIWMDKIEIQDNRPSIKDGVFTYKIKVKMSFPNPKKANWEDIDLIKKKVKDDIVYSKKLKEAILEFAIKQNNFINSNNREEKDMFDIKVECKEYDISTKLNEFNDFYNVVFYATMSFDMAEWWTKSIIEAKTEKGFFFKNYKIRYKWEINDLIKNKTENWKDLSIKALDFSLFNKPKLKSFMKDLTGITMDKEKIEFEITFNNTQNEIKLVLVKGIIKFLKSFGISGYWAKWIVAGLTVFGVLKLIKDKDKEDYEFANKKFNSFLDR